MIREINVNDKDKFLIMCKDFYNMDCVDHEIPESYILKTFELLISGSEFTKSFIYEIDGKIAGYILLAFTYSNEAGGMVVWLDEIYVDPEFRGRGVGSDLIDFVVEKYNDAARFRLEVTESNKRAKKLYISKGFKDLTYEQMEILK
ncbi:GNAT family N-acetyltransferase [Porcipelethomonas sp.]|uniref:GNAT family N-acetyltransferase n=1 Tax=Porcipelethomonas sp. TaxID=2981675 RepID=UPI003EF0BC06